MLIQMQWSPDRSDSILTLPTHSCTYSASFSPHSASILSSVSSDSHLRVFDLRTPSSASNHLTLTVPLHVAPTNIPHPSHYTAQATPPSEALTHDWNKYRATIVAAAGVDGQIRTFDIRAAGIRQGPLAILPGHDYAIRKLAWSPHVSDMLLSASYDMTCRVWTDGTTTTTTTNGQAGAGVAGTDPNKAEIIIHRGVGDGGAGGMGVGGGRELGRMDRHTEFAMGVDWCLFGAEGWCASCGWDERVLVWDVASVIS